LATAPDKPIGNEPIEQQAMLPTATVPVLILAEVGVYRDALARSLSRHERIDVVGVAAGLEEARAGVEQGGPAIVLVDTRMPAGPSAVQALVAGAPDVKVVALAVAEDERDVIAFAEAGAAGYVPLDGSIEDLVAVIESVSRGEMLCSPGVAATLFRHVAALARESRRGPVEARLTARELDVLRLIEEGRSNKEIARALSIELSTVKNHVHNILEKLNVDSRTEAAARARRHDLRSLDGPGS
jgi:two-component system, NarL family, nitrate/nitrite response regulator NarL